MHSMTIRLNEDRIAEAAQTIAAWMADAKSAVAFTGAGISTESGIPDFRSPGGVWSKHRTVYFDEFCRSAQARYEYWQQKSEAHRDFAAAEPNVTHQTLAQWESNKRLRGVGTQNIDGLHQQAGSRQVLELHGTAREIACLDCDWHDRADPWIQSFLDNDRVPDCPDCGGRLKHATVSFGQVLPEGVLRMASTWAVEADLFLTLGSSLVVEPAASLPRIAKDAGARLVILNRDHTPLDHHADLVVNAPLGAIFEAVRSVMS